jgi:multicomponent Na+:H+ antiporter subunit G
MNLAAAVLAPAGAALILIAAVGVLRFPNVPTRLHSATKAASVGFGMVVVGAGAALGPDSLTLAILIAVFQVLTAPIAAHALGRAARPVPGEGRLAPASVPAPARIAGLTAVWLALWGDVTAANLIGGLVAATGVSLLTGRRNGERIRLRPAASLRFAAAFVVLLARSTISVAIAALGPKRLVDPAVRRVTVGEGSASALVLAANSVSLTPGTLTLAIDPDEPALIIHLIRPDEASLRAVTNLHARAMAALPAA